MRYVVQFEHPRRGWVVWHSCSLRRARRLVAKCRRRGWRLGSQRIRNVTMSWWETA